MVLFILKNFFQVIFFSSTEFDYLSIFTVVQRFVRLNNINSCIIMSVGNLSLKCEKIL